MMRALHVPETNECNPQTPCDEKGRLLDAYQRATAEYSRAVLVITAQLTSSRDNAHLLQSCEDTRASAEVARQAFQDHVAGHRC